MSFFKNIYFSVFKGKTEFMFSQKFNNSLNIAIDKEKKDFTELEKIITLKKSNIDKIGNISVKGQIPELNWLNKDLMQILIYEKELIDEICRYMESNTFVSQLMENFLSNDSKEMNRGSITLKQKERLIQLSLEKIKEDNKYFEIILGNLKKRLKELHKPLDEQISFLSKYLDQPDKKLGTEFRDLSMSIYQESNLFIYCKNESNHFYPIQNISNFVNEIMRFEQSRIAIITTNLATLLRDIDYLIKEYDQPNYSVIGVKKDLANEIFYNPNKLDDNDNLFNQIMQSRLSKLNPKIKDEESSVFELLDFEEKQIKELVFLDDIQMNKMINDISTKKKVLNEKVSALDNHLKEYKSELEKFYSNFCLGFLKACKENNQKEIYSCGVELVKYADPMIYPASKNPTVRIWGPSTLTIQSQKLIHGIMDFDSGTDGSWSLGGLNTTARLAPDAYITKALSVINNGIKASGRDQAICTVNHRGCFFFNANSTANSEYGIIDIVLETKGNYCVFSGRNPQGQYEVTILLPTNACIIDDFSVFIDPDAFNNTYSIHFRLPITIQDFANKLWKGIKNKNVKIYIGTLKQSIEFIPTLK